MNTLKKQNKKKHNLISHYLFRRQQDDEETTLIGHVQATKADDNVKPHDANDADQSKVRNDEP